MAYVVSSSTPAPGPRRYPADELLHLRTSLPVVKCVVSKMNKHPDIDAISRIPDEAMRNPDRFSCTSNSLADITNRRSHPQAVKKHNSEHSEETEHHAVGANHSRRASRSLRWSLRRRDSTDRSSQPHSAPSDVEAQQSENFQKFYRAVVSPTHIRVTARGRIVPNTRAPAPVFEPASEWNTEKHRFDHKGSLPQQELTSHQSPSWLSTPLPPGFPSAYQNTCLAPYNLMPQTISMAPTTVPSSQLGSFTSGNQTPNEGAQIFKANSDTGAQAPGALSQQVMISPPTQFDQTKPFMFQGQVVFPAPPGFQPPPNIVPVNMIGNPNFPPHAPNGPMPGFPVPHFPMPLANFQNPLAFPPGHQLPMAMPNTTTSENMPNMVPFGPVPVMGSTSETTKAQIQGAREMVNYIDTQMASHPQQMGDAYLQYRRTTLLGHISQWESILEAQLALENNAKSGKQEALSDSAEVRPRTDSQLEKSPAVVSSSQNTVVKSKKPIPRSSTEDGTMLQVPKATGVQATENARETKLPTRSELTGRSRLTAAAAKAPPFQPRAQLTVLQIPQAQQAMALSRTVPDSPTELTPEDQDRIETRLLSKASSDCRQSQSSFSTASAGMRYPSLPKARSMQERSAPAQKDYQPPSAPRSLTFHGQMNFFPQNRIPINPSQPVPYLVGAMPHGVASNEANWAQVVYPRPLTQEEVRARHLYWGKASHAQQHGLPKFDGKDFYPPSPVKINATMATTDTGTDAGFNQAAPLAELKFENLFTEPGLPGYKTPVRLPSNQATLSSPIQAVFNNGVSNCGYTSGGHSNRSSQYRPQAEYALEPVTPPAGNLSGKFAGPDDFPDSLEKRGHPVHDSTSPPRRQAIVRPGNTGVELPVTPKNSGFGDVAYGDEDETDTSDSWGLPAASERGLATIEEAQNDDHSNDSTVEIYLTSQAGQRSPKSDLDGSFAERVASLTNVEQKNLFLQNMLKNQATMMMSGPVLSGAVSSATATGYLPQYRGSAAASLAPTIMNTSGAERELERPTSKSGLSKEFTELSPVNFLSENRPLSHSEHSTRPSPERLGAERYMRYVSQKDENKKATEQAWKSSATGTGTGPVTGSDW